MKDIMPRILFAFVLCGVFMGTWEFMAYRTRVCDNPSYSIGLYEGKLVENQNDFRYKFYNTSETSFLSHSTFYINQKLELGKIYQCTYKKFPFICEKSIKLISCKEKKKICGVVK